MIPSFGMTWDLLEEVQYIMLDHSETSHLLGAPKTKLHYKRIRYDAFVAVRVMMLRSLPLVQALGGAADNSGSSSPHLQLLHPEQRPLQAVPAVPSCCGVIKSQWSWEMEADTSRGERYLCASSPSYARLDAWQRAAVLFILLCWFGFKFIFQTSKQTN